jgi:electron transport complex protein RnfC
VAVSASWLDYRRVWGKIPGCKVIPKHNEAAHDAPIEVLPPPKQVVLHLAQHVGAPTSPCVAVKDTVKVGQVIADCDKPVSAKVHATISGRVRAIEPRPHPTGPEQTAVVIESDGADEWVELSGRDPETATPEEIVQAARDAGLVGLGGAAFPTAVKLASPVRPEVLILNGMECEPFVGKDYRVMVERAEDLVLGARLMARALGDPHVVIATTTDKAEAADVLRRIAPPSFDVRVLPTLYPAGAEVVLVHAIVGKEVPRGELPMSVGAVVQNVETATALVAAVREGRPLVSSLVSVAGPAAMSTRNFDVRVGTSFADLLAAAGGIKEGAASVLSGGPMFGMTLSGLNVPVIKGTTGCTVLFGDRPEAGPCIRCGACLDVCPRGLNPSSLSVKVEADVIDADERPEFCIECGLCSYVCPENRHLVQAWRLAKARLRGAKSA